MLGLFSFNFYIHILQANFHVYDEVNNFYIFLKSTYISLHVQSHLLKQLTTLYVVYMDINIHIGFEKDYLKHFVELFY